MQLESNGGNQRQRCQSLKIMLNIPWFCAYQIMVTYPVNGVLRFGEWLFKQGFNDLVVDLAHIFWL